MINIGIIGCGKIAQVRHIPEYMSNAEVCLYGLFDIDRKRAEKLAEKYGSKTYDSYEALLEDPEINAVSVCVANHAHSEISIAAMKAGKHVLCEKPMAVTLEECEEMVQTAKKTGTYLMIGQNQRLAKAHQKAKELIAEGVIGRVLTFRTTFGHGGPETWSVDAGRDSWFFDKTKAGIGAMADLGIHKTDLIQYITGQKVVETRAVLSTLDKRYGNNELISVDDNAICIYTLENGAIGTMSASWTYYATEDNATVIYGTKGMLRLYDDPVYAIQLFTVTGEKIKYEMDQIQTNDKQVKSGIIELFVKSIKEKREPEISGESVLSAMRAVFGSVESSRTGKAVKID